MNPQLVMALLGIGVVAAIVFLLTGNGVIRRTILCPRKGTTCEVAVLRRGFTGEGKALRVKSCTAFTEPRHLECKQECLETLSS